jgi:hypothetical protein
MTLAQTFETESRSLTLLECHECLYETFREIVRSMNRVLRLTWLSWRTRKASVLGTVSAHQVFALALADSSRLAY